jgi:hypothetical protein
MCVAGGDDEHAPGPGFDAAVQVYHHKRKEICDLVMKGHQIMQCDRGPQAENASVIGRRPPGESPRR